jgi:hypothetical protein
MQTRSDAYQDQTPDDLEQIRRDLAASLALSAPGSNAYAVTERHLDAVNDSLTTR